MFLIEVFVQGAELFYTVPTSLTSQECPTLDPSKPSILFIHGSSADSRMWQKQFEFQRLAANFNLITLDMHVRTRQLSNRR